MNLNRKTKFISIARKSSLICTINHRKTKTSSLFRRKDYVFKIKWYQKWW